MISDPLDHLAVHVSDREAAEKTMRELLGHERVQVMRITSDNGDAHLSIMKHDGAPFRLVLCQAEDEKHPIAQWVERRGPGVHHLAHRVGALEAALEHVMVGGGKSVGSIVEADGLRQVFTEISSDGILHEITERTGPERFIEGNSAGLIDAGARPPRES